MKCSKDLGDRIKHLDILALARKLGIEVTRYGQKVRCFVHDDHNPSMAFYLKDNIGKWKCQACSVGGSTIDLIMKYRNCTFSEAIEWACNEYFINSASKRKSLGQMPAKVINNTVNIKPKELDTFKSEIYQWIIDNNELDENAINFLLEERKYKEEVIIAQNIKSIPDYSIFYEKALRKWGIENLNKYGIIKYDYGTWTRNPLIIPYYNLNNEVVGLQARALSPKSSAERFAYFKGNETYIYNAPILKKMNVNDNLIISEGVTDCLAALSLGLNAIAMPGATNYKTEYTDLIKNYNIFMFPDNDNAGAALFDRIQTELRKYCITVNKKVLPEGYKDFSDYYKEELWKQI